MDKHVPSIIIGITVAVLLLSNCTTDPATGTEVENERFIAKIVNPDGSAAANATVTVLPVTFIPNKEGLSKVKLTSIRKKTDDKGNCDISDLEEGCYNLYAQSESGKLASFADSVYLTSNGLEISEFTLDSTGTLLGIVRVQPNHDPRIVEVQILGTHLYTNVDSSGFFTFPNIAPGEYRLRCVAYRDDYVPTPWLVTVSNTKIDTIRIPMTFTGIPVVENVRAVFDTTTLHRIVVTWDSTGYRDFYEYVIFRDYYETTPQPSQYPYAVSYETVFIDTGSWSSMTAVSYRYRVAIRNNSMETGPTYGSATASIPGSNIMIFMDAVPDTIPAYDTLQVFLRVECTNSPLHYLSFDADTVHLDRSFQTAENILNFSDTITMPVFPRNGWTYLFISCHATNANGIGVADSLMVYIAIDSTDLWRDTIDQFPDTIDSVPGYNDSTGNIPDTLTSPDTLDTHSESDTISLAPHETVKRQTDWFALTGKPASCVEMDIVRRAGTPGRRFFTATTVFPFKWQNHRRSSRGLHGLNRNG